MLLKVVIHRNKVCQSLYSKDQAFESWRQVVEIILCACPQDLLQGETRQTVLFEILNDLLMKVFLFYGTRSFRLSLKFRF